MYFFIVRQPSPDAPYWPGRRWLAAIDAAGWPLLWVMVFSHAPRPVGIVGPMVIAVALLSALFRIQRAVWLNHRYRFTTWRWGRIALVLLAMGLLMKAAMGVWTP